MSCVLFLFLNIFLKEKTAPRINKKVGNIETKLTLPRYAPTVG
tara:strand:+ start:461 stop:589 length:129 start_codon:yes stop_codon:yes gene_type:complete